MGMKKIFVTLALALPLAFSPELRAQGKHEVNAFVGGFQTEFSKVRSEGYQNSFLPDNNYVEGDLYDLYEVHYSARSGPVVTLNYNYILTSYLRVGAQLSYGGMSGKKWYRMGSRQDEDFTLHSVAVLPQVKACIPGMRHFRLYGKAGIGLQVNFGSYSIAPVKFAWEVVPIGAEWGGKRIYGNAELCWGSVVRGGRIGMGFRF